MSADRARMTSRNPASTAPQVTDEQTRVDEREWILHCVNKWTGEALVDGPGVHEADPVPLVVPKARAESAEADRDRYREALEQIEDYLGTPENLDTREVQSKARAALKGPRP